MRPTPPGPSTVRNRRFGRKVLQADRLARALGSPNKIKAEARRTWRLPAINKKVAVVTCAVIISISGLGIGTTRYLTAQAETKQRAKAIKQDGIMKAKSDAADACRREKAAQKADQIGKITYDELYDYGECDK